jgi:hypothetical protein
MNCPNFRVLSDFRKDHGDFFQDCFKQTVKLALELKLASLGHISLDGSKFKANTSKHKAMSYGHLKEKEQALCAEIDDLIEKASRCDQKEDKAYQDKTGYEIPEDLKFKQDRLAKIKAAKKALEQREEQLNPGKAIDDKKQISFADTEVRIMGKNGRLPEKLSADNGYWSGDNLQALEQSGTDAYIATDKGEKTHKNPLDSSDRKRVKADFDYHEADNTFICPEGQILTMKRESQDGDRVYQGSSEVCADCPLQSRCCQSAKGEARTITTDDKEPLLLTNNSLWQRKPPK